MRLPLLLIALLLVVTIASPLAAQATGYEAQPSGRGRTEVTLTPPRGQTPRPEPATIAIDYGQPHLRGRELHTADLVPYDTPWRTGANAATTLATGLDLTIGGVEVPRGTYVIYTLPTRNEWTLILQREAGQNTAEYDAALDVARIPLRKRELPVAIESLSIWLIPSREESPPRGELRILWGETEVSTDWVVR